LHRDQREHDAQYHRRPGAKQDGLSLLFQRQAAGCMLRAARAMTTALSPDRMMLI